MNEPKVSFSKWNKWIYRDRLSGEYDVPNDYGLLGVYLLAAPLPSDQKLYHVAPEVIYIGMSSHVNKRLDKSHEAVRKYRNEYENNNIDNLYYSEWLSEWSNRNQNNNVIQAQLAFIHYIERKLIWEYAKANLAIPRLNGY